MGVGGLGHLAIQYAQIAGATVAAIAISDAKLDVAKQLGAAHLINAATQDPVEELQALGGADAAIVLAATPRAAEQAVAGLRRNGTAGARRGCRPTTSMQLPIFETVMRGIHVDRVARRHPGRPRRTVRASCRRPHDQRAGVPAAELGERVDGPVLAGDVEARIVFDLR